jgi:hypothetical protein
MARSANYRAVNLARACLALLLGMCMASFSVALAGAELEQALEGPAEESLPLATEEAAEELPSNRPNPDGPQASEFLDPSSADFEPYKPIVEEGKSIYGDEPELRPFDWMRHWGFHHSSTEGRFMEKNVPLPYSSWLNRPYHFDWFVGPLISDSPEKNRVKQSNEIYGGIRVGWDFDYYWGIEWRYGWADPMVFADQSSDGISGRYMVTDVDLIYYPWGDTRVRPYFQLGLGASRVATIRLDGTDHEATLLGMPFGIGLQFMQTHWLAWRLEIVDNLAFASEGIDTMNNVAFTAGMDIRLGARPNSYWPWRSSRTIW